MELHIDGATLNPLIEAEAQTIVDHTLAFVIARREDEAVVKGQLAGSATLISIDGIKGILTAQHVARRILSEETFGLVLPNYPEGDIHQFLVNPRLCRNYSFLGAQPADGPDIAFIVPPRDAIATLEAKGRTFLNLSNRRQRILESPPAREIGIWAVCGAADEWSEEAFAQHDNKLVSVFHAKLMGPLLAIDWPNRADFDYITFEIERDEGYDGPRDFRGYSGGGVRQFIIQAINGAPTVVQRHLLGVAYYQSELQTRDGKLVRDLFCHGRESLYRTLIDKVRSEASTAV
ncbi:MAG: hypothetical protein JSR99_17880 [Proteobacteria bacterium]|nr:hypothetical protein [Pseudomonadota bacterium]